MIRGTRAFFVLGALAIAGRLAIGCATTEDSPGAGPGPEDNDGSVAPPGDGGATSDGGRDGAPDGPPPTCSADGWCHTSLPSADSYDASAITTPISGLEFGLRAVWVAPDHRAWAVSSQGHVLLWDGSAWAVKAVLPNGLSAVWGPSANEIWVAGERGLIMRGTVTGSDVAFQRATYTTNTSQTMTRIVGTSASEIWAIADGSSSNNTNRVWRLNPIDGSNPPSFSPTTVPSTLPGPSPRLRIRALWTVQNDFWIAGYETTSFGKPSTFLNNLVAMRWIREPDGGPSWEPMPFHRGSDKALLGATTTSDGVHLFPLEGYSSDDAVVVRLSTDETKLDGSVDDSGDGGIVREGTYAWTEEFVDDYGQCVAIWATNRNDVWVVGQYGVVRHFDGTSWKLVRTSLTSTTPVLQHLFAIDAVVDPSGEQDMWIVGDDVALHRKIKP